MEESPSQSLHDSAMAPIHQQEEGVALHKQDTWIENSEHWVFQNEKVGLKGLSLATACDEAKIYFKKYKFISFIFLCLFV